MNNETKAKALFYHFCTERTCGGYDSCENCPKSKSHEALLEMAQWKDEQYKNLIKERIDNCVLTDAYESVQYETYMALFKDLFNEEP